MQICGKTKKYEKKFKLINGPKFRLKEILVHPINRFLYDLYTKSY